MQFRRDFLVANDDELELFNQAASLRTLEDSAREFGVLQTYDKKEKTPIEFDVIWSSEKDRVILPESIAHAYKKISDEFQMPDIFRFLCGKAGKKYYPNLLEMQFLECFFHCVRQHISPRDKMKFVFAGLGV